MTSISPAEARAYVQRWKAVARVEIVDRRRSPMGMKLQQFSALMAARHLFPQDLQRDKDAQLVRKRWMRLRKVLSG